MEGSVFHAVSLSYVRQLVAAEQDRLAGVDILVNCAALRGRPGRRRRCPCPRSPAMRSGLM
jgi:NAD(P)-dependent dehydrogenase (short-subunit alcohol dehydrogenase family)